jgi:hypothetical protein
MTGPIYRVVLQWKPRWRPILPAGINHNKFIKKFIEEKEAEARVLAKAEAEKSRLKEAEAKAESKPAAK